MYLGAFSGRTFSRDTISTTFSEATSILGSLTDPALPISTHSRFASLSAKPSASATLPLPKTFRQKATHYNHQNKKKPQKASSYQRDEEKGLTENSQPGRSGSDGRLNGLALIDSVILEIGSQDLQVMLSRQVVSYDQIAWVTCRTQNTTQEAARSTSPRTKSPARGSGAPAASQQPPRSQAAPSPLWQPARRKRENRAFQMRERDAGFALKSSD